MYNSIPEMLDIYLEAASRELYCMTKKVHKTVQNKVRMRSDIKNYTDISYQFLDFFQFYCILEHKLAQNCNPIDK